MLVAAALALVVIAVIYGLMEKPVRVQTQAVSRGPMTVSVEEDGKTRVIDRYTITAPVAGFLRRIRLDEGDPVSAGQDVATLEPLRPENPDPRTRARAQADVDAAEAALRRAEEEVERVAAEADYAQAEYRRKQGLFKEGIVSQDEFDRAEAQARAAEAALKSARFAVEVARHQLEAARTALRYTAEAAPSEAIELKSPVTGSVFEVFRESEGVVSTGEAVMEIGDPSALEVEVDLLSDDAVKVEPGTRVFFERWGGGDPLEGRVRVVEPSGFLKISALGVEEQRVLIISDITSPREVWKNLGDEYRVDASFVIWEGEDVLRVPESALFRHEGGWAVFVVEGGRASLRPVEIGQRNGVTAQVLSGLSEGEEVIIHPNRDVEDGARIKPWQE
ncbi:MAG: efflux RND transporter periplasmic adaptor subunit [Candidatus Abyssobacteria bacterium SURF_5]|uniref:Efflux RND transporter periplasmic adaptor subunit n=1 Tax=Abyssobacteria bacterium (strain SURF_5) TaxID=2093360 RepID=A0A3A4NMQ3_ABYX5|nr:MAG: efflux RND transporter periplasmic adaptor subunit [Candidatus Abyssubacteria bacterium SURF_5]